MLSMSCFSPFRLLLIRELQSERKLVEVLPNLNFPTRHVQLADVNYAIIQLNLDVVVQVPVQTEHRDTFLTACDARKSIREQRGILVPVQVGVAVTGRQLPRTP